jgi:hypothetical protein
MANPLPKEDSGGAAECSLKGAVALRVAAEAGLERSRQQVVGILFGSLNELQETNPGPVHRQRQSDIPPKVATHFAWIGPRKPRDVATADVGATKKRDERSPRQRVLIRKRRAECVRPTPEFGHVPLDGDGIATAERRRAELAKSRERLLG